MRFQAEKPAVSAGVCILQNRPQLPIALAGGPVEALRLLKIVQRSANKARTQAINQLRNIVATAAKKGIPVPAFSTALAKIETRTDALMPDGKPSGGGTWHLMTYEFRVKPGQGAAPKPMMAVTEDA